MGFHTFDADSADRLEDTDRYQWCSREELLTLVAPHEATTVADLGSGTGFYTDIVAPHVELVYAVDVQSEMHEYYEQKGRPANVKPVNASIEDLPLEDETLDAAFSTMTYHEFSGTESMAELARVLKPGGQLVTVDWSVNGPGEAGPPSGERHSLSHAVSALTEAGFSVDHAVSRSETFVCRGRK
ncbi:class I SAM-dependent methyltransferase [Halovenus rubra]|uniref:Class I SAM-dependent methyltransferase n=2 Tax=Halovenus rubra TaxID=869890 RepID=A0ACC7E2Y9_9EURY|nr:class I SAM-dependent methyltransferase [Halovenus rubra]